MNKFRKHASCLLVIGAFVGAAAGCQKPEGPAEKAGKEIDRAVDKAGQQIDKVGEKVKDAVKDEKK